jgi:hypothetical protein
LAHFAAPVNATAYAIEGDHALRKNDLNRASHCSDRGHYWSRPDMFIPNPGGRFKERAGTGGRRRALNFEPIKVKVAESLLQLSPHGGWISTHDAARRIADELAKKHLPLVDGSGLAFHNLSRTIYGWIREEPGRFPHIVRPDA